MPVHIPQRRSELVVTFRRDGEPAEILLARDGAHAWEHAILLITRREKLQAGDRFDVRETP